MASRAHDVLARGVKVLSLAAILVVAPVADFPIGVSLGPPSFEPEAHVTIDGVRRRIALGTPIKQLARKDDQTCSPANYTVEMRSPKELPFGRVTLGTDGDCRLTVTELYFSATPQAAPGHDLPSGLSAPGLKRALLGPLGFVAEAATHEIYGRHVYHEQFHLTVTLAHSQFTYDDNGSSVSNPSGTSEYCWHDNLGWTTTNCYATLDNSGPTTVQKTTVGTFTNAISSLNHGLQAHARASVGTNDATCTFSGSPPLFWHDHCEYGRFY